MGHLDAVAGCGGRTPGFNAQVFPPPQTVATKTSLDQFLTAANLNRNGNGNVRPQSDGTYDVLFDPPNAFSTGIVVPQGATMGDVYQQAVDVMENYNADSWYAQCHDPVVDSPADMRRYREQIGDDKRFFHRRARDLVEKGFGKGTVYPDAPLTAKQSLVAARDDGFLSAIVQVSQSELTNTLTQDGKGAALALVAGKATEIPPVEADYEIVGGHQRLLDVKYTANMVEGTKHLNG